MWPRVCLSVSVCMCVCQSLLTVAAVLSKLRDGASSRGDMREISFPLSLKFTSCLFKMGFIRFRHATLPLSPTSYTLPNSGGKTEAFLVRVKLNKPRLDLRLHPYMHMHDVRHYSFNTSLYVHIKRRARRFTDCFRSHGTRRYALVMLWSALRFYIRCSVLNSVIEWYCASEWLDQRGYTAAGENSMVWRHFSKDKG